MVEAEAQPEGEADLVIEEVEEAVVEVRVGEDLVGGGHGEGIPTSQEQEVASEAADHSIRARRCGVPRVSVGSCFLYLKSRWLDRTFQCLNQRDPS